MASEKAGRFFYRGMSMFRVFRPGDELILSERPFQAFRSGDIICFPSLEDGSLIVHRVRSRSEQGLVTQGDNNAFPDVEPVGPAQQPQLVIAVRRGGTEFRVRGGAAGNRCFALNRLRRLVRHFAGSAVRLAFSGRLPFRPKLELARFAGRDLLFAGKLVAAERAGNGAWRLRPGIWQLWFSAEMLERDFPGVPPEEAGQ